MELSEIEPATFQLAASTNCATACVEIALLPSMKTYRLTSRAFTYENVGPLMVQTHGPTILLLQPSAMIRKQATNT
jgi:hypothetical protein